MTSTLLAKPMIPAALQTAAFTAVGGHIYPLDASAADVPATLPTGSRQGTTITFTRADSSSHSATVTAGGSDIINSGTGTVTSLTLDGGQGESITLVSDGSGHWTIAQQAPGNATYVAVVGTSDSPITDASTGRPSAVCVYWLCANGVTPTNAQTGDLIFNADA